VSRTFDIVVLGLSITSSWGNGHATTYRGLLRELGRRGHRVLFLERDVPWYADNRDMPSPPGCEAKLYGSVEELVDRFAPAVRQADVVIVGSYVPEGVTVGNWVLSQANGRVAFYDIDTPVTLRQLEEGTCDYLTSALVGRYDIYLTFAGGPTLAKLETRYGAPRARPLYCSVDPAVHFPEATVPRWDLGYLGTYGADRQPAVNALLVEPARAWREGRFMVAGPQYPADIEWPPNVERCEHLPPPQHRAFYNAQRYTLNVTRADMVRAGWSPSVRLFEAAACGTPIISDRWPGIEAFFDVGSEILTASTPSEVLAILRAVPEAERRAMAERARRRVLTEHTASHRAETLEKWIQELLSQRARARAAPARRERGSVASE
jgi:spore maturation protein CgeB